MSSLKVSSVTMRRLFAGSCWDPMLEEVIWSGSLNTAGYFPDHNAPTVCPEKHRKPTDMTPFIMSVGPKAMVDLMYSKFGWTQKERFTVETKAMITTVVQIWENNIH